ncbi:TNF receptor-associated factor 3 isoform X2 [Rhipicephalus microplus]|uniref:TNF receptor-associated factor 3 isoform X2 n=1 Tax=Rhipicephalus microplus TaxID=6941 RepID=UPI003F6C071E
MNAAAAEMGPRSSYTLVGYSRDLDWRPTRFVGPVPSVRVCSLCGLIPDATVQLPCAHVLCRLCFDGSLRQGGVCPLDGQGFAREDAEWITLSLESFMRRKVRCWNDVHGCDEVVQVSKLADHFSNECAFHAASCPKCGATVLHRDIVEHLKSGCRTAVVPGSAVPATSDAQSQCGEIAEHALKSVRLSAVTPGPVTMRDAESQCDDVLEERGTGRSSAVLRVTTIAATREAQTQCCECNVNVQAEDELKEANAALALATTQKESLEADLKELKELFAQSFAVLTAMEKISPDARNESAEIPGKRHSLKHREGNVSSLAKQLREGISEVLRAWKEYQARQLNRSDSGDTSSDKTEPFAPHQSPVACSVCHDWCVAGYAALKEVALRDGMTDVPSSPGYFFGYRIEPMIRFKTHGNSLRMHFGLQVMRGENDEQLLWPFHHYVRLWFVVPSGEASSGLPLEIVPEAVDGHLYAKPTEGSRGNGHCLSTASVDLRALESGGYVENDKLRLRFEVLP